MIIYCLFAYQPKKIRVIIDNNDAIIDNEEMYTVHVGICRYSGGGCIMVPHAIYDDKRLSITIVRRVSIWNVITSMPLFYNGKIAKHPKVKLHTANKSIHVSRTLIEVDGELLCNVNEINTVFTIVPHAIRVVVP
jgi:diacylglycerol kinase family enzyme